MKIHFQKNNYISGIVIGKCYFSRNINITLIIIKKCLLVLNKFSYNINTDKEHHFRPLIREIKKFEQSIEPSGDP